MTTVRVETTQYQASHMKAPRGYGSWAFQIGSTIFWAHQSTYTDARKKAVEAARIARVSFVEVLP